MRILTIICFLLSFSLKAQVKTLKLASDVWPPFTNVQNEKAVALDLVSTALNRIQVNHNIEIQEFKTVMEEISNGFYDGSAALWKSPEREEILHFSKPYLMNQLVLVGLKGSNPDNAIQGNLEAKRIGLVKNYIYSNDLINNSQVELEFSNNDQENLEKLFDGKIDFMLVDDLLIHYLIEFQTNNVEDLLEVSATPVEIESLHFALNRSIPNVDELMDRFDEEITEMIKDGTYHDILELNWVRADIDNDGITELVLKGHAAGEEQPKDSYVLDPEGATSHADSKYHVDGHTYDSWDEVPKKFKISLESSQTENKGGLTINFGKQ